MKARYKERIPLHSSVAFFIGSQIGQGRVLDITSPGCLIESSEVVKKGDYLGLEIGFSGFKSPLLVMVAAVRWTKGGQFGVEFIKMAEAERYRLDQFMAQHRRYQASYLPCPANLVSGGATTGIWRPIL
jgi:hypothetical protein